MVYVVILTVANVVIGMWLTIGMMRDFDRNR